MKLKFTYIDEIVNKIEIAYDGINFEDLGEINPAKKENLLANGISLDDKKQLSGFDVNKIIIKANNGEAKKTHLKTAIEPDMLSFKAIAISADYGCSGESGAAKTYDISYTGNLSLLSNHYTELCYLLTGHVGPGTENPHTYMKRLNISIPAYNYVSHSENTGNFPNTSEKFLYMEINNISSETLPPANDTLYGKVDKYGTPIKGATIKAGPTKPGRSIIITENALFPGSGTPVVSIPKKDELEGVLSTNALMSSLYNYYGEYIGDESKLPDYILTYLPKAEYINPKNYTLTGVNCEYGYSLNSSGPLKEEILSLKIRYSGNLSLLNFPGDNKLIEYLFFGNENYENYENFGYVGYGKYIFDTQSLPDNQEDFLYIETIDGQEVSDGFNSTSDSQTEELNWQPYNEPVPAQNTQKKRSILISKGLVRLSDGTVINFSKGQSASIAGVFAPELISKLNILNKTREIPK